MDIGRHSPGGRLASPEAGPGSPWGLLANGWPSAARGDPLPCRRAPRAAPAPLATVRPNLQHYFLPGRLPECSVHIHLAPGHAETVALPSTLPLRGGGSAELSGGCRPRGPRTGSGCALGSPRVSVEVPPPLPSSPVLRRRAGPTPTGTAEGGGRVRTRSSESPSGTSVRLRREAGG